MELLTTEQLENSAVVANCRMNRERNLRGSNGYDREINFDPIDFLIEKAASENRSVRWLDLCCGTATALIEAAEVVTSQALPIEITGVDLVEMFRQHDYSCLCLVAASLSHWQPADRFDLITCVHGLHYIGDKLGLIERCVVWLTTTGRFVAHLDHANLRLKEEPDRNLIDTLRANQLEFSTTERLLRCEGSRDLNFEFEYQGADDTAGPNYTHQPAVDSWYCRSERE